MSGFPYTSYLEGVREGLKIPAGTPVSWRDTFHSRPTSLRQAMRAMASPCGLTEFNETTVEDVAWTDECQGVACDGKHWFFTAHSGRHGCGLYIFNFDPVKNLRKSTSHDNGLSDDDILNAYSLQVFGQLCGGLDPLSGQIRYGPKWCRGHLGPVTYHDGFLYVAHYMGLPTDSDASTQVIVLKVDGNQVDLVLQAGQLPYVDLEEYTGRPSPSYPDTPSIARLEFQGLNPWDGLLYSCGCMDGQPVYEFFKHDPTTGRLIRRPDGMPDTLPLGQGGVMNVQGACFSPNGHLYISENWPVQQGCGRFSYFSALTGEKLGECGVPCDFYAWYPQELEGLCYADLRCAGWNAQIHLVLLENCALDDDVHFKWFGGVLPDYV
jgi:hypothetical protein